MSPTSVHAGVQITAMHVVQGTCNLQCNMPNTVLDEKQIKGGAIAVLCCLQPLLKGRCWSTHGVLGRVFK